MKSSQSNFDLRSPDCYWVRSYLNTTVVKQVLRAYCPNIYTVNSGYIAVAHLFKDDSQIIEDVKHFLKFFIATLENDELIDKASAMWKFDEFFKTAHINLLSFSNFVTGILRKPNANKSE